MAAEEVDVVVLGLGPGGESVATSLAQAGLRVVGVNDRLVGGECPYYACIPTKMMLRAAETLAEADRVQTLAGSAHVEPDWNPVHTRVRDEATSGWDDTTAVRRLEDSGVRFVRGHGRISAPGEVTIDTANAQRVFRARRGIVLNPGTHPAIPPIEGLADTPFWTNREAVQAAESPRSIIVLGAGPVGMEFAQVFARFGVSTTVVEAADRLLLSSEPEAGDCMARVFEDEGITVRTGAQATTAQHDGSRFTLRLDSGEELTAERLLVATGRSTDLTGLGVATVGLDDSAKTIPVDGHMRAAEMLWTIGDVTGKGAFTHTSVYQAEIAVDDILGRDAETADYRAAPAVTFTEPEVATIGMTEATARDNGINVRTGSSAIPATPRGWIHKAGNAGLIKLVAHAERDKLVGATVVSPAGGEVAGALAVAIHGEVPISALRRMMFAYPTFHRAIEPALQELGEGVRST